MVGGIVAFQADNFKGNDDNEINEPNHLPDKRPYNIKVPLSHFLSPLLSSIHPLWPSPQVLDFLPYCLLSLSAFPPSLPSLLHCSPSVIAFSPQSDRIRTISGSSSSSKLLSHTYTGNSEAKWLQCLRCRRWWRSLGMALPSLSPSQMFRLAAEQWSRNDWAVASWQRALQANSNKFQHWRVACNLALSRGQNRGNS